MIRRRIAIDGFPIFVVSDAEANQADFVVCLRIGNASPFSDNETGVCSHCGAGIFFRPYMPKAPPKICLQCATAITDRKLQ